MMPRTPIMVELLVCEACGHVGKVPVGLFDGKGYCTGPKDAPHKKVRMQARTFQEVREDQGAAA